MSAFVLDAGALIAVDRDDRAMLARLRVAELHGFDLRTNAVVVAQVWRSGAGRQARLARFLASVDVRPIDGRMGREAGALLGKAGTDDPIDATLVLVARPGDRILTSDPDDIGRLVDRLGARTGKVVAVIPC